MLVYILHIIHIYKVMNLVIFYIVFYFTSLTKEIIFLLPSRENTFLSVNKRAAEDQTL